MRWACGPSICRSRVKPRLRPGLTWRVAAEFDAVVQTERTVMPELEPERADAPAAPAGRTRHRADQMLRGNLGDRLFEGETAFQRLRLFRCPCADLRLFGAGGEIGIGLGIGHRRYRSPDAYLPAQRLPVKE